MYPEGMNEDCLSFSLYLLNVYFIPLFFYLFLEGKWRHLLPIRRIFDIWVSSKQGRVKWFI